MFANSLGSINGESPLRSINTEYIQFSDFADIKKRKNKENVKLVISYWFRLFIDDECSILTVHLNVLLYCIEPSIFKLRWSEHHKSSLIQLFDKNKTALIHQKSFRKKKNNEINFDQLSKTHYIQSSECIPYRNKDEIASLASISFEIYEHFVADNLDRNECALHGSHKIGIASNIYNPKTGKKYFIGLSSTYHQTYHRKSRFLSLDNKNANKYKQDGVLFTVDVDGKKKAVKNGIAIRKFETITMKIDWINKMLIFKRQRQNECSFDRSRNESLIYVSLKSNVSSSFDITKMEWYPCCAICLNQTDSFMWNHETDDFIRITLLPGDIL